MEKFNFICIILRYLLDCGDADCVFGLCISGFRADKAAEYFGIHFSLFYLFCYVFYMEDFKIEAVNWKREEAGKKSLFFHYLEWW